MSLNDIADTDVREKMEKVYTFCTVMSDYNFRFDCGFTFHLQIYQYSLNRCGYI